jgi:ribosomal protein L11 methyltransferase
MTMNTVKITLSIAPFENWFADVLMAEMADLGFESFMETENGFEAFTPEKSYSEKSLSELLNNRKDGFAIEWKVESIPAQNWNEVWEKNYFQPLVIRDRIVIRASFHDTYPACPIEIVINPNMAFGTGNHETTSLMMETMLEMSWEGKAVLDMGCGTGILAILASKLGAETIAAIDNDPWSFNAVSENLVINNTLNIKPLLGDAGTISKDTFDVLLVNIQKNVILSDMADYVKALKTGGIILLSGFYETDLPDIQREAEKQGLKFDFSQVMNKWSVAVFHK